MTEVIEIMDSSPHAQNRRTLLKAYNKEIAALKAERDQLRRSRNYYKRKAQEASNSLRQKEHTEERLIGLNRMLLGFLNFDLLPQYSRTEKIVGDMEAFVMRWSHGWFDTE